MWPYDGALITPQASLLRYRHRPRRAAMPRSSLESLPTQVQELVLDHLHMRDLASLGACSRALRGLICRQPHSVWRAAAASDPAYPRQGVSTVLCMHAELGYLASDRRLRQQACARQMPTLPPACRADPVHKAPCILSALRLRQHVHHNLAHGVCVRSTKSLLPHSGCACADPGLHVRCSSWLSCREVTVRDLRSQQDVRRWPLPCVTLDKNSANWRWDGKTLALKFSAASLATDHCDLGVMLLDTATGLCTPVVLSTLQQDSASLYDLDLSSWSRTGFLLIQHRGLALQANSDQDQESDIDLDSDTEAALAPDDDFFSAVDAQGRTVCMTKPPVPGCLACHDCWSPDGGMAVLCAGSKLWLWDVAGSGQLTCSQLVSDFRPDHRAVTWSHDSSRLLLQTMFQPSPLVWSSQEQGVHHMPDTCCMGWGRTDIAVLLLHRLVVGDGVRGFLQGSSSLTFCQVTRDGSLQPLHLPAQAITYQALVSAWATSPDGEYVCMSTSDLETEVYSIEVLHMVQAKLLWRLAVPFPSTHMAWSADGTCLIACGGPQVLLLDFA